MGQLPPTSPFAQSTLTPSNTSILDRHSSPPKTASRSNQTFFPQYTLWTDRPTDRQTDRQTDKTTDGVADKSVGLPLDPEIDRVGRLSRSFDVGVELSRKSRRKLSWSIESVVRLWSWVSRFSAVKSTFLTKGRPLVGDVTARLVFLPRDAPQCKARSCYRLSSVRLSVHLWRWWIMTT